MPDFDLVAILYLLFTLVILLQNFSYSKPGNFFGYVITIFVALFVLDLISGFIHIFLDRYNGENPYIKPVADSFKEHHDDPAGMVKRTNFEVLFETRRVWFMLPFLVLINYVLRNSPFISYVTLFSTLLALIGPFMQVSHRLSHLMVHDPPPKNSTSFIVLNFLQKNGVLLNPELHRKHHKINDKHWPIFNGWSSNFMDFMF